MRQVLWTAAFAWRPPVAPLGSFRLGRPLCSAAGDRFAVTDDGKILRSSGQQFRLSPSAISTFRQCALLFKLRYIERLPEPPTPELCAGILVHAALADIYKLPPGERTLETSRSLFREAWRTERKGAKFGSLFNVGSSSLPRTEFDVQNEREWGLKAFDALARYFQLEDPTKVSPQACEERFMLELDAGGGAAGLAPIPMTGTIDRIDRLAGAGAGSGEPPPRLGTEESEGGLVVIDYKTGKAPPERFRDGAFFQLKVYALLLRRAGHDPKLLRLLYLGDGTSVEAPVDEEELRETERELRQVWGDMGETIRRDAFPPSVSRLCDWCAHQTTCPAWTPQE